MAKTVDLRTYLVLERAFVRRLQRSWRIQSAPTYAAIAKACNEHNWDKARQLVPDLDMAEVGTQNREWITYMLLSLAVFGAGTVAKGKPSFVGVGTFDTFLKQVTNNLLMYLEYRATAQVQAEALQSIAEDEAKTKALKFDESLHPRDEDGRFTNALRRTFVMSEELLRVARGDTERAGGLVKSRMESDAQGVVVGAVRQLDAAVQRGEFTLEDVAAGWQETRTVLREQYGESIILHRHESGAENPGTLTVYMGDKALAEKFGPATAYEVPVSDVIAVYARPSGYYEFIVKKPKTPEPIEAVHGTAAVSLESILKEGIKVAHSGEVWPDFSHRDSVYVTVDEQSAKVWGAFAAQERRMKITDPEYPDIAIIKVRIPPERAADLIPDENMVVRPSESPARQFKGDIPPEWIVGAQIGTKVDAPAVGDSFPHYVWKDVPLKKAAADGQIIYVAIVLQSSAEKREYVRDEKGRFAESQGTPSEEVGKQIAHLVRQREYAHYGVRVDNNSSLIVGQPAPVSNDWSDPDNPVELTGTSAIEATGWRRVIDYSGSYIVLLGSNEEPLPGTDRSEIVMPAAVVLGVWPTPVWGTKKFDESQHPREPGGTAEGGQFAETGRSGVPTSDPVLAVQAKAGIAAVEKLLPKALQTADFSKVQGGWQELPEESREKAKEYHREVTYDRIDIQAIDADLTVDVRWALKEGASPETAKMVAEKTKVWVEGYQWDKPLDDYALDKSVSGGKPLDFKTLSVPDPTKLTDAGYPVLDLNALRHTDGTELTGLEKDRVRGIWKHQYEKVIEDEIEKAQDSDEYLAKRELLVEGEVRKQWENMTEEEKNSLIPEMIAAGKFRGTDNPYGPGGAAREPQFWKTGVEEGTHEEEDFARTHAIANQLTILRTAELLEERGLLAPGQKPDYTIVERPEAIWHAAPVVAKAADGHVVAMGKTKAEVEIEAERWANEVAGRNPPEKLIDTVWEEWKRSSSDGLGASLQLAAARELGGHHRMTADEVRAAEATAVTALGNDGMATLQAYVRAQWEVTQMVMHRAGEDNVSVYRGLMLPGEDVDATRHQVVGKLGDPLPPPSNIQVLVDTTVGGQKIPNKTPWPIRETVTFDFNGEHFTVLKARQRTPDLWENVSDEIKKMAEKAWAKSVDEVLGEHKDDPTYTFAKGMSMFTHMSGAGKMQLLADWRRMGEMPPEPFESTESAVNRQMSEYHESRAHSGLVYFKLPDVQLQRAGAQSTTGTREVANDWGGVGNQPDNPKRVVIRVQAPATSVLSLPVYGENIQEEHESVLLGTKDKWLWDAWENAAPDFASQSIVRKAETVPLVIDFQAADRGQPHWMTGVDWSAVQSVAKWDESQHPRDKGGRFVDAEGVTHVGGFVELYHGTSLLRANKILKEGFKIRAVPKQTMGGDSESNRDYIWLAKQSTAAQRYSEMHLNPTVLTVRLPEALYKKLTPYGRNTGPDSVWVKEAISAKYVQMGGPPAVEAVEKALGEARDQLSSENGVHVAQMSYSLNEVPITSLKLRERKKAQPALTQAYQTKPEMIPPVSVRRDGNKLLVLDGHRRIQSAKAAGKKTVWVVEVHSTTSLQDEEARYPFDPKGHLHHVFKFDESKVVRSKEKGHEGEFAQKKMVYAPESRFLEPAMDFIESELVVQYLNRHGGGYDENNVPLDEMKAQATATGRAMLERAVPTVRVPDFVAVKILEDGRFKSQHESGRSRGTLDPEYREEAEKAMFGTDPKGDLADRPIYGIFMEDFAKAEDNRASQYGEVVFVLKDSVLDRTTVSFGDSLSEGYHGGLVAPRPYREFDWVGVGTGLGLTPDTSVDSLYSYAEAQYHGGVTLEDVKEVMVPLSVYSYWETSGTLTKFKERGIAVRVIAPTTHKARV